MLILTTTEETIATVPATLQLARQQQGRLQIALTRQSPIELLNTLELLGLPKEDVFFPRESDSTDETQGLTQWLGDLVGKQRPTQLLVSAGSALADVCKRVSSEHQIPLSTIKRDLSATTAFIEANKELTALLERQTPFIPPTHKIIVAWARAGQYDQEHFQKTGEVLLALAEELDVSIVYPVRMDTDIQKGLYQSVRWHENIHLLEPFDPLAFIHLLGRADLLITGSSTVVNEAQQIGCAVLTGDTVDDVLENLEVKVKAILAD